MKRSALSLIALVSATVLAGPALADVSTGKTREQVKAELAEAIRTGDIIGNAETGQKLNEINPSAYPAKPAVAGKTREQVKAELAEAIRTGDIIGNAETGQKLNELYPHRYPAKPAVAGKTRQQVKDELSQAQRDGTMPVYVGG